MVVAPSGVLADQGLTLAVLQEKHLALVVHDVDGHVAARYGREMSHFVPLLFRRVC
jgi:hypothetical protein